MTSLFYFSADLEACDSTDPLGFKPVSHPFKSFIWFAAAMTIFSSRIGALAGQGAVRMLYTSPNMSFVEKVSGEIVVNVND